MKWVKSDGLRFEVRDVSHVLVELEAKSPHPLPIIDDDCHD